ncbi:MAG: hypothetical protein C4527_27930 [Candidatus Omnitrophota bacterium]|jgi:N-acetylglucosamine kinase|nr:MAG: hypothetical protein C4527_27930 [Candidatus Omnitrophota bacterium]
MPYVFGIDGGGSTSRAILITDAGRVVHLAKGPGVNYHEVGAGSVSTTISRLFKETLLAAHARQDECRGVCLGLAGVGREQDRAILKPLFDEVFGKNAYLLVSDAEIALTSGNLSESGIVIIAGTGTILFGRNEQGREGRVGGHGPLLSDEGSGYCIALQGLRAIVRSHDGFEGATLITKSVLEHLKMKTVDELIPWVYAQSTNRRKIAALASFVIQAANEDDPLADEIINQEADALALGVEVLKKKLEMPDCFDVVLSGGLFSASSYYRQIVRRKLLYLLPGANVVSPQLEPVIGAGLYAMHQAGVRIDNDLLDAIRRTYRELMQANSAQPVVKEEAAVETAPTS